MLRILLPLLAVAGVASAESKRPNVLFIVADDLGWRDLGVEGSAFYETPNIDRLARSGRRFARGYATCQVCSPSRASLMTGKYPVRSGITTYIGDRAGEAWKRNTRLVPPQYTRALPAAELTVAEAFRDAGYATSYAGKWHLGGDGSTPEDHGFDLNRGGRHWGTPPGGFFSPYRNSKLPDGPPGEWLPLRLGRETAEFIRQDRTQPFFACLAFYSVHAPIQTPEPVWRKYRDKAAATIPTPDHRFQIDRTLPVRQVQDHPVYAGMVEGMDRAVGIVLQTLDELGLTDETIVCFTSDNGGVSAGDGKATSNLPLRGGKGRQWEGGLRVPFHIAWPGKIAAGLESNVPVTGADFFPTLLELAGIDPEPAPSFDGTSLAPLLLQGTPPPDRPLFWHYPHYGNQGGEPSSIIQAEGWKLIRYHEDNRVELYDLSSDPGESTDVARNHPERVADLQARLSGWLEATDARFGSPNPAFSENEAARQAAAMRDEILPRLESQAARFLEDDFSPGTDWWGSRP